ncbi:caspase family protein [Streptomyces sp. NPDC002643]
MSRFDPRGKANRALLVGVSEYDHTRPPDGVPGHLPAVHHNRTGLSEVLHRGAVFDEGQITVCPSPAYDGFWDALHRAAQEAEGLLLFYFAGHGIVTTPGDELFLQMRNARVVPAGRDVLLGAAQFTHVLAELAGSGADRVVVILDCCYAGNAAEAWQKMRDPHKKRKILLLMSAQPNRRIDARDGGRATPFTRELIQLLDGRGELSLSELYPALRERLRQARTPTVEGDPQAPQASWEPGEDVLLRAVGAPPPPPGEPRPAGKRLPPGGPHPAPRAWRATLRRAVRGAVLAPARAVTAWLRRRVRAALGVLLGVAVLVSLVVGITLWPGSSPTCAPPLHLRVLTDPDLERVLTAAAGEYFTSPANTTDDGCRRTGIGVYSAGAADAVRALRVQTDAWQRPPDEDDDQSAAADGPQTAQTSDADDPQNAQTSDDDPRRADENPQRDVGPQPDVWIPATRADHDRVTQGQDGEVAHLGPDTEPFAYSPVVLAVPDGDEATDALAGRRSLREMITVYESGDPVEPGGRRPEVRRTDPEFTDSALLATMGLYADGADVRTVERGITQTGPPSPTAADLLCTLPDDGPVDDSTAVLVPEFLLKSGVGCDRTRRAARTPLYPDDVPGLEPTFIPVTWSEDDDRDDGGDDDDRADAVDRFRVWLTGEGGRAVLGEHGFRSPDEDHRPLGKGAPDNWPETLDSLHTSADPEQMNSALKRYGGAHGPGQVLFLLDSSKSMDGLWDGGSGAPALIKQSLGGLGEEDEYGVWAVYGTSGRDHTDLLPFGRHRRTEADRALDTERGAGVRNAEADPHAALLAALDFMRGADDQGRPQLIVHVSDGEDNTRLTGRDLDEVVEAARTSRVPIVMVSLADGGCAPDRADARIAAASAGRCLPPDDKLGAALHDEVARTGTGEE